MGHDLNERMKAVAVVGVGVYVWSPRVEGAAAVG
jgi:hypothetical protein